MLQKKLIVDRFIHFRYPTPPKGGNAQYPAIFIEVQPNLMTINQSSGFFSSQRQSTVTSGSNVNKPWRTFGWLPWLPGSISEVKLNGNDVLTGPMSGCDLVMYLKNGVAYAGHLGTDVGATNQNASVKNTWNTFATNSNSSDIIGGFNPLRDWNGPYPKQEGLDTGSPIFLGLYTTVGTFYTLVLYSQKMSKTTNSTHLSLRRIAGLQQINSMSYNQLCNL